MAAFEYTALDGDGRRRKGVLEADSMRQIRQLLRDKGLAPLAVAAATRPKGKAGEGALAGFGRRLTGMDRVLVTRQLATLVGAGLPVEEALGAVADQTEKQGVRALIMGVRSRVLEGHSLAGSLAEYPGSFNALYRSTVAAGEQSGFLDRVLANLANFTERQFEAFRNVQMALLYPVVLFCLALAIVGALLVLVVPDMVRVLDNMGRELPWTTQFLIGLSEFLAAWWWALLAGVAMVVFGLRWLLGRPPVRTAWDRQKLRLPLAGRIARASSAARYANTLSILTSSGVPLLEAMGIAGDVVANAWLRQRLQEATQRVREGASLGDSLAAVGHFPAMLLHMVASGEASGELDAMLERVAVHQQAEVERIVTALTALFPPLMLLLMGGMVMFIVMAILLPILNMNQVV